MHARRDEVGVNREQARDEQAHARKRMEEEQEDACRARDRLRRRHLKAGGILSPASLEGQTWTVVVAPPGNKPEITDQRREKMEGKRPSMCNV